MRTRTEFIDGDEYEVVKKSKKKKNYRDPLESDGRGRRPPEKKQRRQDWLQDLDMEE